MPDGATPIPPEVTPAATAAPSGRAGRTQVLAFITDTDNGAVLRVGLQAANTEDVVVHRGNIRVAIGAMTRMPTPQVLVVDISGEEQPLTALTALAEVLEPDVRVLVVGERQDVNLYRHLTRVLGVAEYLYKPLNAEVVAQHFGPVVAPTGSAAAQKQGGRIVTITSMAGGAGATTIAANLAWYLAAEAKRHTVLLDADLHTGNAAMLLGAKTGGGLRLALETPERVDELFMERIAQPGGDRLAVIAGEERLTDRTAVLDGAAQQLFQGLRQRYNYIIVDLPLAPVPWYDEVLDQARQRVLVMEPTLAAVRDVLRVMALPIGSQQTRQPMIVLNKSGIPGTLTRQQVEDALAFQVGVAIPHLPRVINAAATMGTPAAATRGAFRVAIRDLAAEVAASGIAFGASSRFSRLFRWRAA